MAVTRNHSAPFAVRFKSVQAVLEQAVRERAFPGAAYGIFAGEGVAALGSAGRFTYDPASPLVTPSTVFDLASLTKVAATTAIAMRLYDRNALALDMPLGDILPDFVAQVPEGMPRRWVTLRALLAHSSGLPGYARLFEQNRTARAMRKALLRLPLETAPGKREVYSDPGFMLLGMALEALSGKTFGALFRSGIAVPLGLEAACFRPRASMRAAIPPTERDGTFRHRVVQGEVQDENSAALGGVAGHAGLFANCSDLLLFAACILNHGATATGQPLFRPATVDLFATRQSTPAGASRALGWDTPTEPSQAGRFFSAGSIGHLGYAGTSLWIDRERGVAAALLTNRTWPDRANRSIRMVRPAFHDAVMEELGFTRERRAAGAAR